MFLSASGRRGHLGGGALRLLLEAVAMCVNAVPDEHAGSAFVQLLAELLSRVAGACVELFVVSGRLDRLG